MKNSLLYSFSLLVLVFASCEDKNEDPIVEPTTAVMVATELYSDGEAIEVGDTMVFEDGTIFNLKLFKLYLSNLTLLDEESNEYLLKDVALIDVGDASTGSFTAEVPGNLNFTTLKMGFGVDAAQNNSDPTSFPDEHPLSSYNQMYWTMLKYRFAILEGRSNATGSFNMGSDVLNAYHPGTDPIYQTRTYNFDNPTFSNSIKLVLKIDVEDIFYSSPAIDLATESSTHSEASDIHIAQKFMSNLAKSSSLEVEEALSL